MDINDFYTRVLKTLDVCVKDGYLMIKDGEEDVSLTHDGLPLALPTKKHIGSVLTEDDSGAIVAVKHLFNPMDETVIKGDSVSLTKLKKLVDTRLSNRVAIVGRLLLIVSENEKLQSKTPMLVNQFLIRLTEADNPGIKKIVDQGTIDKWVKIYDKSFESGMTKFMNIYLKKGGRLGSVKYNRVATIKFPIYEELLKLTKGGKINGVTLRNKDITVFKIMFEYLIEGINDAGIVTNGSLDKECPGFISIMHLYLTIMFKIQEVIKGIKDADVAWSDAGYIDMAASVTELTSLAEYATELVGIPREGDVISSKLRAAPPVANVSSVNTTTPVTQNAPQAQPTTEDASATAIHKALYGNISGINQPMQQQAPQYQQAAPQLPRQMQQPAMGYPQQPVQQPMQSQPYQQPMQQQFQPQPMQQPVQQPGMGYPQQQYPQPSIGAVASVGAFGAGTTTAQPQQHNPASVWGR